MLTDTFVRQVKHKGSEIGERYADGGGMYLRVKAAGRYWRMDYRFNGKAKTLALGVYPAVSLAKASTTARQGPRTACRQRRSRPSRNAQRKRNA